MKHWFLCLTVAFFSCLSYANSDQEFSLEYYDSWGSGEYQDVININDIYYVDSGDYIDVIDPSLSGNESLINQMVKTCCTKILAEYQQHLVVLGYRELEVFDVSDPQSPTSVFTGTYNDEAVGTATVYDGELYFLTRSFQLNKLSFVDDEFSLQTISTLEVRVEQSDGYYRHQDIRINDGKLHALYQYYTYSDNAYYSYLDVYNLSDMTQSDALTIDLGSDMTGFEVMSDDLFAINTYQRLNFYQLTNDELTRVNSFSVFNGKMLKDDEVLWVFRSFEAVKLGVEDILNLAIERFSFGQDSSGRFNSFHVNRAKGSNSEFYMSTSDKGIVELSIADDVELSFLFNQSGYKSRGALISNDQFVLPKSSQSFDNKGFFLSLANSEVSLSSEIDLPQYDLIKVGDRMLAVGYNSLAYLEFDESGAATETSTIAISHPLWNYQVAGSFLFVNAYDSQNNDRVIYKYDLSSAAGLNVTPQSTDIIKNDEFGCADRMVVTDSHLLLLDQCKRVIHILSNGENTTFEQINTVDMSDENYRSVVSHQDKIYFIGDSFIRTAEITAENTIQFVEFNATENGYSNQTSFVDESKLYIKRSKQSPYQTEMVIYDLSAPNFPELAKSSLNILDNGYSFTLDNNYLISQDSVKAFFYQFNYAPDLSNDSLTIEEDKVLSITDYIQDQEGDSVTIEEVTAPTNGVLELGDVNSYTPNTNFYGADSFEIKLVDDKGNSKTVEVSVAITAVNDLPQVGVTEVLTQEDTSLKQSLEIADVEGDSFSFRISEEPTLGTATLSDTGELSYTPKAETSGDDTLVIELTDENGQVTSQEIKITIEAVNDLPVVMVDDIQTDEEVAVGGKVNVTDIDSEAITFSIVAGSGVNGSATINNDGEFTFTPAKDASGLGAFDVNVSDGTDDVVVTINIEIAPINDAPTVSDSTATATEGRNLSGNLSADDVDGDELTYSVVSDVTNGSLELQSDGSYTYTPNAGYTGEDSFTYQVSDGEYSAQAKMTLTVRAAPVAPAAPASSDSSSSGGGGSMNVWLLMCLFTIWGIRVRRVPRQALSLVSR
ncbi:tandem-95 repeat protein [Thalassotalea montiporae]